MMLLLLWLMVVALVGELPVLVPILFVAFDRADNAEEPKCGYDADEYVDGEDVEVEYGE